MSNQSHRVVVDLTRSFHWNPMLLRGHLSPDYLPLQVPIKCLSHSNKVRQGEQDPKFFHSTQVLKTPYTYAEQVHSTVKSIYC